MKIMYLIMRLIQKLKGGIISLLLRYYQMLLQFLAE